MEEQTVDQQPTDIFAWASEVAGLKDGIDVELFLFNRKYTVYSAKFSKEITIQLKQLFLVDLVNYVVNGPDQGVMVRQYEEAEEEKHVIQRTEIGNVENAAYVVQQIEVSPDEVAAFSHDEHDMKRIKAIMARFSHPSLSQSFYAIKQLQQSNVLTAKTSWMLEGQSFGQFTADAAVKIAPDNQMLIVGDDVFVFHQRKFVSLFGYDAKQHFIAKKKVAEIEAKFRLSFPEGTDMQTMVKDRKRIINKLQQLELAGIKQEQLLEHAEEMGVELLTDDSGAIIIMDGNDMDRFVNLLNDDYVASQLTGNRYEIRSKKVLTGE